MNLKTTLKKLRIRKHITQKELKKIYKNILSRI